MKVCSKCRVEKFFNEFALYDKVVKKYRNVCKKCISIYQKQWCEDNKEHRKQQYKQYHKDNKEKRNAQHRQYHKDNKERINVKNRQYKQDNKEKVSEQGKQHYQKNKIKINKYRKNRKQNDIQFKIACNLRTRVGTIVRNNQKSGSAVRDLGCSVEELKQHLESKFYLHPETEEQMSWENYGLYGWHIDHRIALSKFDLMNRKQFLEACHHTNLQPLWAEENFSKGNK